MKKTFFALPFLALFFFIPSFTQAEECFSHADVSTDQSLKVVSSVNLRDKPCMETSKIIGGLVGGQMAHIVAVNDGWYKVQVNDQLAGWVWGDFLVDPNKVETDPTPETEDSEPVDPADQECYKHEAVPTDQTFKVKEALNLRDGACAEATQILAVIYPGEIVKAVQVDDGWYNIHRSNGTAGWVWGAYLTDDLNEPIPTDSQPEPTDEETPKPTEEEPATPAAFTDIEGTLYKNYIEALHDKGVLKGNPDGTYNPYAPINRAEFTMTVIRPLVDGEENISDIFNISCFNDIPMQQWYTKPICYAKKELIIGGYPDGFFRPGNKIVGAEAFKILVETFDLSKKDLQPGQQWYEAYAQAMSDAGAVPPTLMDPSEFVSREEMAAMMYAVMEKKPLPYSKKFNYFPQETSAEPTATTGGISMQQVTPAESANLKQCVADSTLEWNMDYNGIAQDVLEIINADRKKQGLAELKLNPSLSASSMVWAMNGEFTHARPNGQTFDQYQQSIGVTGYTEVGESLAQRALQCDGACTGLDVVQQAQAVHDLFMAQKNAPEGQRKDFDHLMNSAFTQFGFGFQVEGDSVLMVYQFADDGVKGDEEVLCEELK